MDATFGFAARDLYVPAGDSTSANLSTGALATNLLVGGYYDDDDVGLRVGLGISFPLASRLLFYDDPVSEERTPVINPLRDDTPLVIGMQATVDVAVTVLRLGPAGIEVGHRSAVVWPPRRMDPESPSGTDRPSRSWTCADWRSSVSTRPRVRAAPSRGHRTAA